MNVIFTDLFGKKEPAMPTPNPAHVLWCRQMWEMLADGGSWGLPNNGLIFRKDADAHELVLVQAMPHMVGMPMSPDELLARQISLYIDTIEHFSLIGVTVRRDCDWPVVPAKGKRYERPT
jgi:hypothetical protein